MANPGACCALPPCHHFFHRLYQFSPKRLQAPSPGPDPLKELPADLLTWFACGRHPCSSLSCHKDLFRRDPCVSLTPTIFTSIATCCIRKQRPSSLTIPFLMMSCAFDHLINGWLTSHTAKLSESRSHAWVCTPLWVHTVGIQLIFV